MIQHLCFCLCWLRRKLAIASLTLFSLLLPFSLVAANAAGEYSKHSDALSKLSIAVAQAMPAGKYGFRPHPESMNYGELMSHIATTNYQFCAGLKDSAPPALPSPKDKDGVVKFLSDSFDYCSSVIANLTEEQLNMVHSSPDGRLPGREVLLAMYIHVAHHRGQAEIYLRDNGIKPPPYRI
ncbi:MAG TPA: DinB family protein [Bryobacteraceae bacterium]|nr:DinB family protein [Bryobacteraceae bacterium]